MDVIRKPIKRSQYLAPLSREHHETLLFVWKIRQGIRLSIEPAIIGKFCKWYWENTLKTHFQTEEKCFSKLREAASPFFLKMTDDHQAIEAKFIQVIDSPTYASIHRLAQLIDYHIRFEERSVFAYVQDHCSEEAFNVLAGSVGEKLKPTQQWQEEFWVQKKERN